MKKLVWFIILVFIVYLVLIFIKPTIANKIAENLGIENFNKKVIEIKEKLDYVSTKVPTKDELEKAYSGAKDTISNIKDNIDDIRKVSDDLEDKYVEAKEFIDETGKKIEKATETVKELQEVGNNLKSIIGSGAVN